MILSGSRECQTTTARQVTQKFLPPQHSSAWKHTFHDHQMAHKCKWRWTEVTVSKMTMKWDINI